MSVPLSTSILTRPGWIDHHEVKPGHETLGLNPETGRLEWTVIRQVLHSMDAEVWRIGNSQ